MRSRVAAAVVASLSTLAIPAAAEALTVGIGDQKPASFSDARLRALSLRYARLIVPWNAAGIEPGAVQAWLDAAAVAGMRAHVAFEHARSDRCPSSPCVVPTRAQYRSAVAAFHARFPQVTTFTTWNEANHQSQPVASRPEAVAGYYEELTAACPVCTVVAGDVLDSGTYVRWLERFDAATSSNPQLWGLHNYGDVTYSRTTGTDAVLAAVPGQLWLEETGGIVTLRSSSGRETLRSDESRAATSIDQAFSIARARSRVTRMYIYQWQARPLDRFDAGLVRPDGATRPSYAAVVRNLGLAAPTATTTTTAAAPRWRVTWSKVRRNQLLVRVTCRTADLRCAGRVTVVLRTRSAKAAATKVKLLATRRFSTTSARKTATLRIRTSAALRRRVRRASARRLALTVNATLPAVATTKVTLKVPRPG